MNDIEKLINYIKDNSTNFLGSKATLKDLEEYNYMYDQLMTALEKQVPKTAIETQELINIEYICPVCNRVSHNRAKYCWNCGQAIIH